MTITWNHKYVTLWRGHKPMHRIFLHGRDPMKVYEEILKLLAPKNVVRIERKVS